MRLNTQAYLRFKTEAERLTNTVVLFSHSVPVLRRVLAVPGTSLPVPIKPADNFPGDRASGNLLLQWADDYDQELARLVVLSVFSYFEAYVRGAIDEIYTLQGGHAALIALAEKRAKRHWGRTSASIASAKRALQTRDVSGKVARFQKYSRVLDSAGFAFPPELLAAYGARMLARKLDQKGKGFRAWEIPELLEQALLLKPTTTEMTAFSDLRELRNKVAHGSAPKLTLDDAIKRTSGLRKWAAKIDSHISTHFLVLAKYRQ